jgi:hypothetical protein
MAKIIIPRNKFNELEKHINSTIDLMPTEFDTHQLILVLAQKNQRAYIEAIHESTSKTPFQAVHSRIGKKLKKNSLIQETQTNNKSLNIFGKYSTCSKWIRLN